MFYFFLISTLFQRCCQWTPGEAKGAEEGEVEEAVEEVVEKEVKEEVEQRVVEAKELPETSLSLN